MDAAAKQRAEREMQITTAQHVAGRTVEGVQRGDLAEVTHDLERYANAAEGYIKEYAPSYLEWFQRLKKETMGRASTWTPAQRVVEATSGGPDVLAPIKDEVGAYLHRVVDNPLTRLIGSSFKSITTGKPVPLEESPAGEIAMGTYHSSPVYAALAKVPVVGPRANDWIETQIKGGLAKADTTKAGQLTSDVSLLAGQAAAMAPAAAPGGVGVLATRGLGSALKWGMAGYGAHLMRGAIGDVAKAMDKESPDVIVNVPPVPPANALPVEEPITPIEPDSTEATPENQPPNPEVEKMKADLENAKFQITSLQDWMSQLAGGVAAGAGREVGRELIDDSSGTVAPVAPSAMGSGGAPGTLMATVGVPRKRRKLRKGTKVQKGRTTRSSTPSDRKLDKVTSERGKSTQG